ncbi:hypothetical protein [Rhodococcus rhodochrous]|nr:hypothetical protein [Rhodococcus rhodochrous]
MVDTMIDAAVLLVAAVAVVFLVLVVVNTGLFLVLRARIPQKPLANSE